VLADGTKFIRSKKSYQALAKKLNGLKSHFVYHRLFRSEREYLAILLRGNPVGSTTLKFNRPGYPIASDEVLGLSIKLDEIKKYNESYQEFIKSCGLTKDIESAVSTVLAKSDKTLDLIPTLPIDYDDDINRVLSGLSLPQVAQSLEVRSKLKFKRIVSELEKAGIDGRYSNIFSDLSFINEYLIVDKVRSPKVNLLDDSDKFFDIKNISKYRSLALKYENIDINISMFFINIVLILKKGPQIKKDNTRIRDKFLQGQNTRSILKTMKKITRKTIGKSGQ
jgi:hypothetical protein